MQRRHQVVQHYFPYFQEIDLIYFCEHRHRCMETERDTPISMERELNMSHYDNQG